MNMVFVGANPDKSCQLSSPNSTDLRWTNVTYTQWEAFMTDNENAGKGMKDCRIYDTDAVMGYVMKANVTFDDLQQSVRSGNLSFPRQDCDWNFSREVYGPTIVTQVST